MSSLVGALSAFSGIMRAEYYNVVGRFNVVKDANVATMLRYTGKKHTNLSRTKVELLNLLGTTITSPRKLMANWNTHHHGVSAYNVFGTTLLELIDEGFIATVQVELEPKPSMYNGTFTVNPDGTATFVTSQVMFGRKLTVKLNGIKLDSTFVNANVNKQSK